MSAVLVDSNVLLDILLPDPEWEAWSSETLARTAEFLDPDKTIAHE